MPVCSLLYCIYFLHHPFLKSSILSSFLSRLLMKCPFRIPMYCSRLGNSESSEAGRVQSGRFFFTTLPLLPNVLVINTCACIYGTCMAHTQQRVLGFFFFFFFNGGKIFLNTMLSGVDASGSSTCRQASTLLVLALITSSASGIVAHNEVARCQAVVIPPLRCHAYRHVIKDSDHWEMADLRSDTTGTRKEQVLGAF